MSWQAITAVIASSRHKGSELLCLIMLSNYADPDGGSIFPSIGRLADDCRMSRSTVQRCIKSLLESTELIPCGLGPEGVNRYAINLRGYQVDTGVSNGRKGGVKSPCLGGIKLTPDHISREQSEEEQSLGRGRSKLERLFPFSECFDDLLINNLLAQKGFGEEWRNYIKVMREARLRVTRPGAAKVLTELAIQPGRAVEALRKMGERGWRSFQWEWMTEERKRGRRGEPESLLANNVTELRPSGEEQRRARRQRIQPPTDPELTDA